MEQLTFTAVGMKFRGNHEFSPQDRIQIEADHGNPHDSAAVKIMVDTAEGVQHVAYAARKDCLKLRQAMDHGCSSAVFVKHYAQSALLALSDRPSATQPDKQTCAKRNKPKTPKRQPTDMDKLGQKLMQFGKYKDTTMREVVDTDRRYVKWALGALKNSTRSRRDFYTYILHRAEEDRQFLKDSLLKDPLLKDAWYLDPKAQALLDHEVEPDLWSYTEETLRTGLLCAVEELDSTSYESLLDQTLLKRLYAEVNDRFAITLINGDYYLKPEIINAAMSLHDKYQKNIEADEEHIRDGTPSKVITRYWLRFNQPISYIPPGKWTIFVNRTIEDANGLTKLDVCYRLLRDYYTSINGMASAKVSTRRANSTATNNVDGVLVIYCDEKRRVGVLYDLARVLSLENKRYYWKYHTKNYSKDGVKASDYSHYLKAPTEPSAQTAYWHSLL